MRPAGLPIKNIAHSIATRYKMDAWRDIAMSGNFTTCKSIARKWEIHVSAPDASVLVCFRKAQAIASGPGTLAGDRRRIASTRSKEVFSMDGSQIVRMILDFITTSPANTLKMKTKEPAWEEAIMGFASGADSVFESFKEHVGPFHFTPAEIFNLTFPDRPARPEDLTVINWVLPQREATKADNRTQDFYPSERWVMARFPGDDFNMLLRQHVVDELGQAGCRRWPRTCPRSGGGRTPPRTALPRAGPSATRPMPRAWAPSDSATG